MKFASLVSFVALVSAAPMPSMFGDVTKEVIPGLKKSVVEAFASSVDEITRAVENDVDDYINSNIEWIPTSIKLRMECKLILIAAFLHNRVVARVGAVVEQSIKLHTLPKLEIIMDTIAEQMMDLDRDIEQSITEIHNNIRKTVGNLPPVKFV